MKPPILPFGFFVLAVVSGAIPAAAQTTQGASAEIALTAHPDEWYAPAAPRGSGRTTGIAFGAGTDTARFELSWPSWHEIDTTVSRIPSKEHRRTISLDLLYRRSYTSDR